VGEDKNKKMAGVVRLIEDPYDETAEFSLVVADKWQGQGLGSKLTDTIIDIAKKRKLKKVYADYLPDNNPMEYVFKKRNFTMRRQGDIMRAELEL
jgi:acetyltransferase